MRKYISLPLVVAALYLTMSGCGQQSTTYVEAKKHYCEATILETAEGYLLVEPADGTPEKMTSDQMIVYTSDIAEEGSIQYLDTAIPGDKIQIGYLGDIAESYPAQISGVFELSLVERAAGQVWDKIPMIMVDGKLYYDTGRESTVTARCGMMDGEINSSVDGEETPAENNQSNFGYGYGYQYGADDTLEVFIDDKWIVFEYRAGDGS